MVRARLIRLRVRASTGQRDGDPRWPLYPRLLVLLGAIGILAVLTVADPVAGGAAVAGVVATTAVVRRRSRPAARIALLGLIVGVSLVAIVAALVLPVYSGRPGPLIVTKNIPRPPLPVGSALSTSWGGTAKASVEESTAEAPAGRTFEVLGFVASDYEDSAPGVARDAAQLSTLAATGIALSSSPGGIEVSPATDTMVRAHVNGAGGLAVVSNYDGTGFNGGRAQAALASAASRHRLISALSNEVARGWDGVVLDFERLPPEARPLYPMLVRGLAAALAGRRVVVALPAYTDPADPDMAGYDFAELGAAADRVVLMTYDEHHPIGAAGPMAGLPWVREAVSLAVGLIPRAKMLLGIPGYGYLWSAQGPAKEQTVAQAKSLAAAPGASARWDDAAEEWQVITADGGELWYEDARSSAVRAQLALSEGLAGVALWRVGSEDATAVASLAVAPLERPATATAIPAGPAAGGKFEALGFVASDIDDSAQGVDRDAAHLSTLAATGIMLSSPLGDIDIRPGTDTLVRAHLNGAAGLAVVSNYDGAAFNAARADAMLASPLARSRLIAALSQEIARRDWDGVVLDFERLPPAARSRYPQLVRDLNKALPGRRVLVAVPASDDPADPEMAGYDLAALGAAADQVVVMTYDEHYATGTPGPVASLFWVEDALAVALQSIPRDKLLLGIPGYGYLWPGTGKATDVTVTQAKALAGAPGASARWDDAAQEWHVQTATGGELWYEDARSTAVRAQLALSEGLAGVALWRVGSEDPAAATSLPVAALKHRAMPLARPVHQVQASGLVALTFDDGPDPSWTPQVLAELRRLQVPATFFVVGKMAQRHPGLVRQEINDGNVVANHTWSHKDLSKLPQWRAKAEILGGSAVIEGITGSKPLLFRSPYGVSERTGIHRNSDQLATDLGLHAMSWNDDAGDWMKPGVKTIVQRVLDQATERTVILMHDGGGNRAQTVAALPGIVEGLRAQGYLFVTADALDGSTATPYTARHGMASKLRGVTLVAGFRLQVAARRVVTWLLLAIALLSILRLVVCAPLAAHHWRRHRRAGPNLPPPDLSVSILIPAHNEEAVIAKTLLALDQHRRDGVEVIVIDDGSTDKTADVAEQFPVKVLRQDQAGKAAALNHGIAEASGDIVVVLDADTILSPNFVTTIATHFTDTKVGAVAGNVKVGNRRGLLPRLQALEYIGSLNLDRRAQATLNVVSVVPGAAGAFRRSAILQVGGYSSDTRVEDADLTISLLRAGWRIPYEPDAVAWTEAPQGVRDVIRQRRRWSFGTVEVAAKHADIALDPRHGSLGLLGLPWLILSQVILPLGGPLTDLYLLYLVAMHSYGPALAILAVALILDLAIISGAVLVDHEQRRLLLVTPFMRLVWRPLQLIAAIRSVRRWMVGRHDQWHRVHRHNSVPTLSGGTQPPRPPTVALEKESVGS